MRDLARGRHPLAVLATLILVAGCGTAGTPSPTGTPTSSSSAHPTSPTSSATSPAAAEAWDLVWFSDSNVAGAAELYAAKIHERLGVDVLLHNFWGPSVRGSAVFIAEMSEVDAVEQAIKEAEVIVLYANPARTTTGDALGQACIWEMDKSKPQTYTAADFTDFADHLRFIYDRIFELRAGRTAVIRALDAYVGTLPAWKAAGIERQCTASWEAWTSTARVVAGEYHVPMASMYDAFNGPRHDQDPAASGLIGADGAHPSEAGSALQASLLDALGYDPVKR